MSLYYDAQTILNDTASGTLKSRTFANRSLKCSAAQVYALAVETRKWSAVLTEVIQNAGLLAAERKLNPVIALLLVHDLLLANKGIAAPTTHPLRTAVERHKTRLIAELTKARVRRKCAYLKDLRRLIESGLTNNENEHINAEPSTSIKRRNHPRWIRINTLRTTLAHQSRTTFSDFEAALDLEPVLGRPESAKKQWHTDQDIPNLVAVDPECEVHRWAAYLKGEIILQDKASCFPAYLLDPQPEDGMILDACAAPGNKTTHLAAIRRARGGTGTMILACERDQVRSKTLSKMIKLAGAAETVKVSAGQDFLQTHVNERPWNEVGAILLDPSCSGSGMLNRDEEQTLDVPSLQVNIPLVKKGKKRKRQEQAAELNESEAKDAPPSVADNEDTEAKRLAALSAFQLKLLLHAFNFPKARKVVYSTCSIHDAENETVVAKALSSKSAQKRGWSILPREKQVSGMKKWDVRGRYEPCKNILQEESTAHGVADSCIRCNKRDGRGTMGFFVAGFIREEDEMDGQESHESVDEGSEWEGFSE